MGLLSWILIGALAGGIANMLTGGQKKGCLTNIIVGILGAFLGGLVVGLLGGTGVTGFNLYSIFVAVLGSMLFLWLARLIGGRR